MPSDIGTEDHGRFQIKSLRNGGQWQARALHDGRVFGDVVNASTREAAVDAVKAQLDEQGEWPAPSGWIPSVAQYRRAFASLGGFRDYQKSMLDAHLAAPDNILTATELANAAGYDAYASANYLYGTLGKRIAEILGWSPPKRSDGTPIWTYALAFDADEEAKGPWETRPKDGSHFRWQLRPEVIEALR